MTKRFRHLTHVIVCLTFILPAYSFAETQSTSRPSSSEYVKENSNPATKLADHNQSPAITPQSGGDSAGQTYSPATGTYPDHDGTQAIDFLNVTGTKGLNAGYTGILYVTQPALARVLVFDSNGAQTRIISSPELKSPVDVYADFEGNVFILDDVSARVLVYDHSGNYMRSIGEGKLVNPRSLAVDSIGIVYVCADPDPKTGEQIYRFGLDGSFDTSFGVQGSGEGELSNPAGMSMYGSGNLLVADSAAGKIVGFYSGGSFEREFGQGVLQKPMKAVWNEVEKCFLITDTGLGKVVVLKEDGTLIEMVGASEGVSSAPEYIALGGRKFPKDSYISIPSAGVVKNVRLPGELPGIKVWYSMLAYLEGGNIDMALQCFTEGSRERYAKIFTNNPPEKLRNFAQKAANATLDYCGGSMCLYLCTIAGISDGQPYNRVMELFIVRNELTGEWKIMSF